MELKEMGDVAVCSKLFEYVRKGNASGLQELLCSRPDLSAFVYSDQLGRSCLHVAANRADVHVLNILIQRLNDLQEAEEKLAHREASSGKTALHLCVERLLRAGDDDPACDRARVCVGMLLEAASKCVNVADANGETPLMAAVATANEDSHAALWLIQKLISAGADLDMIMPVEEKSIRAFVRSQMPYILLPSSSSSVEEERSSSLLRTEDVWRTIERGGDLHALVSSLSASLNVSDSFWNCDNGRMTFLQLACSEGNIRVARDLLSLGADPNLVVPNSDCCDPPCFIAAKRRDFRLLKLLIGSARVDLSARVVRPDSAYNIVHAVTNPDHLPRLYNRNTAEGVCWDAVFATRRCLELLVSDGRLGDAAKRLCNDEDEPAKNTPLHYATHYPSQEIALVLLMDKRKRAPGVGLESLFAPNVHGWEPATRLAVATLRTLFDSLVRFENGPMDTEMAITLHIEPLLPKRKRIEQHPEGTQKAEGDCENAFLYVSGSGETHVPELEYVLRLRPKHEDLFDHPVVAGAIWAKWSHFKTSNRAIWLSVTLRVLLQVFGLGFVLFSFGGASLPFSEASCLNASSPDPGIDPGMSAFNCYPLALAEACRVGLLCCWALAFLQLAASLLVQIRRGQSWDRIRANLLFVLSASDTRVMVVVVPIVPYVAFAPSNDRSDADACRDVCGLFVVLLCVDACFLLRDHLPNRRLAAMINWTEVVTATLFGFVAVHAFLVLGFAFAFYIQLHDDAADKHRKRIGEMESPEDGDDNKFSVLPFVPMKVLAMFIGELDYAAHPFVPGLPFNYLVFALFLFLVVIVLMNLLTGVAVNDVHEIANASADRAWLNLARKVSLWEEAVANARLPVTIRSKFLAFAPDTRLVCYPNGGATAKSNEIVIAEQSICDSAVSICLARIARMDEEGAREAAEDEVTADLHRRIDLIEERLARTSTIIQTTL